MIVSISFCITVVNDTNFDSRPALHIWSVNHPDVASEEMTSPSSLTVNASMIKATSQFGHPRNTEGMWYSYIK